jgi:hypothetical protein
MLFFICYTDCYDRFLEEPEPIINNYYDNQCIICFENQILDETHPLNLTKHNIYIKTCNCDCLVHIKCLKMWFDQHKKCPICRMVVAKNTITNNYINISLRVLNYVSIVYKFIIKMSIILFNILLCISIIYFIHVTFYLCTELIVL